LKKEVFDKLCKKAGVLVVAFGFIVAVLGFIFVVPNIEKIENMIGEFWTVSLLALMFACLSIVPIYVLRYVEDKQKTMQ